MNTRFRPTSSSQFAGLFLAVWIVAFERDAFAQAFPFVIPGDDSAETVVDRSGLIPAPVDERFVSTRDGHFYVGDRRLRFWGVNFCFGANFPTHAEADLIAPHLAKLGINAVRFHHMDMQDAPGGIWAGVDSRGVRNFDPEMVDRLDYFLAKLHEQGIYANLNLHVSRTLSEAEGFPPIGDVPWWASFNKWVMYYDRDVQAEVLRYSRLLLNHANPYRDGRRRVEDPGIAVLEMLNENYFSEQGYGLYRQMPKRFQLSLIGRWNEWLVERYGTRGDMLASWKKVQPAMGQMVIPREPWKTDLGRGDGRRRWSVHAPDGGLPHRFVAGPKPDQGAVRLEPKSTSPDDYRQQLAHANLSIRKGQPLTLSFRVRSDRPRTFKVELSTSAGGQWRDLDLYEFADATPTWQRFERVLFPKETVDAGAVLAFSIGNDTTPIEFAAVALQNGASAKPLPANQSLTDRTIGIPESGWPVGAHRDMTRFMIDTEIEWTTRFKRFLTETLGVKVPITASQVNYHHPRVNRRVNDFVDMHNYWHHPMFPADSNWNPDRWTVGNDPMEADPARSDWPAHSLLMRMPWRYAGKPMTLSEWNYPEPSPYASGCVPMAAVLCSLQDWDGVFFFQYDSISRDESDFDANGGTVSPFFRDRADQFFSFNGQPVKLALLSQCANIFLRGDLSPLRDVRISVPDEPIDGRWGLTHRLGVDETAEPARLGEPPDVGSMQTPDGQVRWVSDPPRRGHIELNTKSTVGLWGTIAGIDKTLGPVRIQTGSIRPDYGSVLLSSTDGAPIADAKQMVLLVASHSENRDMGWNEARDSVGRDWGRGPTQVTTFKTAVVLPGGSAVRCFSLSGTGERLTEIPVRTAGDRAVIGVSPNDKTLWYEIIRE